MRLILEVQRFNPKKDKEPSLQHYEVEVQPTDRILDALVHIKNFQDSSLSFRKSCAHGVCGSDGMVINGVERLACKTLVKDVAGQENTVITIEPLRSLPVQRDLMVDYTHFFDTYRIVKPFLIPVKKPEHAENIQTPQQR